MRRRRGRRTGGSLTFRFKRFQYSRIIHANQKWCLYVPGGWNRNRSDFRFLSLRHVNCYGSLLSFCIREINRFLEIPIRESWKILRVSRNSKLDPQYSKLETRASKLDSRFAKTSRIENRVSSRDRQLTFARYCSVLKGHWNAHECMNTIQYNTSLLCNTLSCVVNCGSPVTATAHQLVFRYSTCN